MRVIIVVETYNSRSSLILYIKKTFEIQKKHNKKQWITQKIIGMNDNRRHCKRRGQ